MNTLSALFWVSLFGVLYAYAGYPMLLGLLAWRPRPSTMPATAEGAWPALTMVISAYNEEKVIGKKLEDTLALDYPAERLEIVVVSDGSTDQTTDIVRRFAGAGVVLRHYEGRIGKTACLNQALPLARGELIVFSDANSEYAKGALKALARPFTDGGIGFVTGWTSYGAPADGPASTGSLGLYSRLEFWTKDRESRIGSCIGADGAIFAIRKALYVPLQPYDINDFVIPLSINRQGFRGVLSREAVCIEQGAGSAKGEFHRQVRITNRTIRAIFNYRDLLNPARHGLLAFEILSHKVCKFIVPFLLLALLLSSVALAAVDPFFAGAFVAQVVFYAGAALSTVLGHENAFARLGEAARTFVTVNAAIGLAWVKYWQGETYTTWSPTKR